MAAQSVLIVDDEPDIRELLDITLSRMGLETHSAASLGEAQARISEVVPDLCRITAASRPRGKTDSRLSSLIDLNDLGQHLLLQCCHRVDIL